MFFFLFYNNTVRTPHHSTLQTAFALFSICYLIVRVQVHVRVAVVYRYALQIPGNDVLDEHDDININDDIDTKKDYQYQYPNKHLQQNQ